MPHDQCQNVLSLQGISTQFIVTVVLSQEVHGPFRRRQRSRPAANLFPAVGLFQRQGRRVGHLSLLDGALPFMGQLTATQNKGCKEEDCRSRHQQFMPARPTAGRRASDGRRARIGLSFGNRCRSSASSCAVA